MTDVGFIGVGKIGNPMCANVIKGGHRVVVHDLVEEHAANLIELGAVWAESPRRRRVPERGRIDFVAGTPGGDGGAARRRRHPCGR